MSRPITPPVDHDAHNAVSDQLAGITNPAVRLRTIREVRHLLDGLERDAVHAMRANGATWEYVAAALDVTRQWAWERFHDLD